MSLQSDLEFCLEYAEALESKRDQRLQAQSNISYLMAESERLHNKLSKCRTTFLLSAIGAVFMAFIVGSMAVSTGPIGSYIAFLAILAITAIIALVLYIKTRNEFNDLESKKPSLIQQYAQEAEECEQELIQIVREIYRDKVLDIVPEDYFSVAAINFCLTQVRKKLATTATEAFRQLDAEIKRMEQMAYMEELNNAQLEQLSEIKRAIDINTMVTIAEHNKYHS